MIFKIGVPFTQKKNNLCDRKPIIKILPEIQPIATSCYDEGTKLQTLTYYLNHSVFGFGCRFLQLRKSYTYH